MMKKVLMDFGIIQEDLSTVYIKSEPIFLLKKIDRLGID